MKFAILLTFFWAFFLVIYIVPSNESRVIFKNLQDDNLTKDEVNHSHLLSAPSKTSCKPGYKLISGKCRRIL